VERREGSQLVSLSYLATNPELAAEAANAWVEELIAMESDTQIQKAEEATGFLRGQLADLKVQVEQAEVNLIAYARQHRILDLDTNSESVVRRRLTQLTEELTRAEANLAAQQARHTSLARVSKDGMPASVNSPVITDLESRVFKTEQDLVQLKAQFGDQWPAVLQKESELKLAKQQLDRAKNGAVQEVAIDSQFQLNAAMRQYESLKSSAEKQAALVSRLNEDLVAYNALNRDFQTTNELYQSLLQRLKETAIVAGLERRRVHMIDPAAPNSEPYRPRKALTLLLALTSALGLGCGLSLVLQTAGDTFSSPEEVERLGVPVLGALPRVRKTTADEFLAMHGLNARRLEAAPSNGDSRANRYLMDEEQLLRESYRSMCSSLILSRPEGPPKTILVSSALPREGKTTTATAIGAALAELGAKTILVDADLRNPSLSRSYGLVQGQGLSTFLSGGAPNIVPTDHPNLSLLPAGPPAPNPMALFSSARMSELIHELNKQFEFVVIDSPPVLGLADSVVLASQADGVVIVSRAGKTPRTLLRQTVAQLKRTGAVILGAAVSQVEDRRLGYSRYSGYHSPYTERTPSDHTSLQISGD
jgi:capsular exopolysaccharide synthesis family protein